MRGEPDYVMADVYSHVGIPKLFRKASLADLDVSLDYKRGTFLWGDTEKGKTHALAALANEALLQTPPPSYRAKGWPWQVGNWDLYLRDNVIPPYPLLFISVAALIMEIKGSFKPGARWSEEAILRKYARVPFLFLDDFGAQLATDWSQSVLDLIVDQRYGAERHLAVTSNLSPEEFRTRGANDRIASRILAMCPVVVEMKGPDRRL